MTDEQKERRKLSRQKWRENHKAEILEAQRNYRARHREELKLYYRNYRRTHPEYTARINAKKRESYLDAVLSSWDNVPEEAKQAYKAKVIASWNAETSNKDLPTV